MVPSFILCELPFVSTMALSLAASSPTLEFEARVHVSRLQLHVLSRASQERERDWK